MEIPMLQLAFWFSPALQGENAAKNAISALTFVGATFLGYDENFNRYPVFDPYTLLKEQFRRFEIQHHFFGDEVVKGSLISGIGFLMLLVPADHLEEKIDDQHAQSLLKLSFELYPLLRPRLAWVDVAGDNAPREREIANLQLRHLMWANFFSPEYVKKYGREFIKKAPGWRHVELPGGGIAYILSESCLKKNKLVSQKEIIDYFSPHAKVRVYQALPSL
jgi:hypothetical protein